MSKTTINPFRSPLDIAHMLRNQPPALDHVLPGLLAKTVGLIVGPGAVSKTMLVLQLGIALATGTRLFGGLVGGDGQRSQKPERVVLVFAEELPGIVWHRLQAIASVQLISTGIDPERAAQLLDENLVIHSLAGGEQVNLLGNGWCSENHKLRFVGHENQWLAAAVHASDETAVGIG